MEEEQKLENIRIMVNFLFCHHQPSFIFSSISIISFRHLFLTGHTGTRISFTLSALNPLGLAESKYDKFIRKIFNHLRTHIPSSIEFLCSGYIRVE